MPIADLITTINTDGDVEYFTANDGGEIDSSSSLTSVGTDVLPIADYCIAPRGRYWSVIGERNHRCGQTSCPVLSFINSNNVEHAYCLPQPDNSTSPLEWAKSYSHIFAEFRRKLDPKTNVLVILRHNGDWSYKPFVVDEHGNTRPLACKLNVQGGWNKDPPCAKEILKKGPNTSGIPYEPITCIVDGKPICGFDKLCYLQRELLDIGSKTAVCAVASPQAEINKLANYVEKENYFDI